MRGFCPTEQTKVLTMTYASQITPIIMQEFLLSLTHVIIQELLWGKIIGGDQKRGMREMAML